jgi:hypothetical protein
MDTIIKTDIIVNPQYKAALATLKSAIKLGTDNAKKGIYAAGDYNPSHTRRCRLLAYTFLRGKTYRQVESNPHYLRTGFFGNGITSLRYYQKSLATDIAKHIPKDLGDGTTDKDTSSHIIMWLDMGHVTRDQIINNRAEIEATRSALAAVGAADLAMQEWNAKVDRITHDRFKYMQRSSPDAARVARYDEDRAYAVTKAMEAVKTWLTARHALETALAARNAAMNQNQAVAA